MEMIGRILEVVEEVKETIGDGRYVEICDILNRLVRRERREEVEHELPLRPNANFFTRHDSTITLALLYVYVLVQGNDLPRMVIVPSVLGLLRTGHIDRLRGKAFVAQHLTGWFAYFSSCLSFTNPEGSQVILICQFVLWLVSLRMLMSGVAHEL